MARSTLSRRSFVAAGSAAVAAGLLPRVAAAAKPAAPLGIQLYSLRGYDVDTALAHAKDLGFQAV